ncbi:MAG TPA: VWA domain-containing protein [Pyrinomonadaceae bacterium]|nr:VWA domain-containing protein [Pyrinomonadaceae bacterium]
MEYPKVEFFTTHPKLEAGREQTVDVLIRITPPALSLDPSSRSNWKGRPDLNLSLVLDRSGSMEGEKMVRAREAAMFCVDQMLPTDRLSVVTFDDRIEVLFPSEPVTNKQSMKDLISRVTARGSTALHEAWVRGGLTVSERMLDQGINRVVLITDGLANVGITNTDEIVTQAMGLYQRGVSTSTIGIGADFNEDLLMPMAQSGGGNAWHVVEPDDMQRIFQVELEGLIAQFAHTVSLSLIPADGVRVVDLLNDFDLTETGRYRLPNLQAGSPLDVVVQLRVGSEDVGTQMRLLDLRLGFTPQDAKNAEVLKQAHTVEFANHAEIERSEMNEEVIKAVQLLMNARARNEAMKRMDRGDYAGAEMVIGMALGQTQAMSARCAPAAAMTDEMASLQETAMSLKDRLKDKMSRKKLAYAAYSRQTGKAD